MEVRWLPPSRGQSLRCHDKRIKVNDARRDGSRPAAMSEQILASVEGRWIANAVDTLRPEMALERGHHFVGGGIVVAVNRQTVAVIR
jgi:hypothetical protein